MIGPLPKHPRASLCDVEFHHRDRFGARGNRVKQLKAAFSLLRHVTLVAIVSRSSGAATLLEGSNFNDAEVHSVAPDNVCAGEQTVDPWATVATESGRCRGRVYQPVQHYEQQALQVTPLRSPRVRAMGE